MGDPPRVLRSGPTLRTWIYTLAVGLMSEILVGSIKHASEDIGLSQFFVGVFVVAIGRFPDARLARAFFAVGVLGAFTTFSSLATETVLLAKDHHALVAAAYPLATITAGLLAAGIASAISRRRPEAPVDEAHEI